MAEMDITPEEIQSKLRLLRRPASHKRSRPLQAVSNSLTPAPQYTQASAGGACGDSVGSTTSTEPSTGGVSLQGPGVQVGVGAFALQCEERAAHAESVLAAGGGEPPSRPADMGVHSSHARRADEFLAAPTRSVQSAPEPRSSSALQPPPRLRPPSSASASASANPRKSPIRAAGAAMVALDSSSPASSPLPSPRRGRREEGCPKASPTIAVCPPSPRDFCIAERSTLLAEGGAGVPARATAGGAGGCVVSRACHATLPGSSSTSSVDRGALPRPHSRTRAPENASECDALSRRLDAVSLPASPTASPTSASSSRGLRPEEGSRREEGIQYLCREDLVPFSQPQEDRHVLDVLRRLGSSDEWAEQFAAINEFRRLVCHAPKALVAGGGHLRKAVGSVITLIDSLRSALAKNALRCTVELFTTFGKRMDPDIEMLFPVVLRRAADTNSFIAEEAELVLKEMCKAATETKLTPLLLGLAAHRQPRVREKAVWCVAMLAQRLLARASTAGAAREQLRSIMEAVAKALGDANADVRQSARMAAMVFIAANCSLLDEYAVGAKLTAAMVPGLDLASFDVYDLQCAESSRGVRPGRACAK